MIQKGQVEEMTGIVHERVSVFGGHRMNFDRGHTVGNQIESFYNMVPDPGYKVQPVFFGNPPIAGKTAYSSVMNNAMMFETVGGQMSWDIRDRLHNTWLLLSREKNRKKDSRRMVGTHLSAEDCLFIDPTACNGKDGAPTYEKFINQLTQPIYKTNKGRVYLEKSPDGKPSPDLFDGVSLCFRSDIDAGLRSLRQKYRLSNRNV